MPPAPCIVHALPGAPTFTGREEELARIASFWEGPSGVLSVNGVGGSGKTALVHRFVTGQLEPSDYDGLLVWSFYDDPDVNAFLQTAYGYFTGGAKATARGAGWFHLLRDALSGDQRYLLVLDGLERVQQSRTDSSGVFGQLEDPLLRGLLRRLVTNPGHSKAVITSRFPISDLERWLGRGYEALGVDLMTPEAIAELFQRHGLDATEGQLRGLIQTYGLHALTVDLLAGAVAAFYDGDAGKLPPPEQEPSSDSPQAGRLASVLRMYQRGLSARDVDLLSRLCVFRFGVTSETLASVFAGATNPAISGALSGISTEELSGALDGLAKAHLIQRDSAGAFTVHPAVRDHFYRLFRDPGSVHEAVSSHLLSLTTRPGIGLPSDKASLDLLEELVYHALRAGREEEARFIYFDRLGGNDHLNTALGEYTRTHRILAAFPTCPDPSAMYHSLRAFGRFEEALEWRPQNRYIAILSGRLTDLSVDASDSTRRVARYLQGDNISLPERFPDLPLPISLLMLFRGRLDEAERTAQKELEVGIYHDDIVRNRLALVEIARRRKQPEEARAALAEVAPWVLASSSHEHLCLMHLIRTRLDNDAAQGPAALVAAEEGLQVAEDSGFGLMRVLLLVEVARSEMVGGGLEQAMVTAAQARAEAGSSEMRFVWAQLDALKLELNGLARAGLRDDAEKSGKNLVALMREVDAPRTNEVERMISQYVATNYQQIPILGLD